MYWSHTLIPTMKEIPGEAEIPSHILMLRAGLVCQVMAGAYSYLPLGFRSLHKAVNIVREEMNRTGAVEVLLTALAPQSLYEQTNRVEAFGNVLIKTELRRGVPVVLCPTHEEEITSIVAQYVNSYRQLPLALYQIQTKFRNEERPRFGVLRTSEFIMKDAYSFHTSLTSLNDQYKKMYDAYCRIFHRCGLLYLAVEAESGPIGGDASHEFMLPSPNGEDKIVHCKECGYAANIEKAEIGLAEVYSSSVVPGRNIDMKPISELDTPDVHTIEQVCTFLKTKPTRCIKTLIYLIDDRPVAVLIRGDHEVNSNKIKRTLNASKAELADDTTVRRVTGAPVGFAGPVGLAEKVPIYADVAVMNLVNAVTGANKADKHYVNVNADRDFHADMVEDFRNAVDGDTCPRCHSIMKIESAIEAGHIFKLGTKYSEALSAKYLDDNETQQTVIMGCYGIGVNRIIAGLIETSFDDAGIIFPVNLAPYEVVICPMKVQDETTMHVAQELHDKLEANGIEVLLDDRDQRAGVKFKDADLIGFPLRVVVGEKGLAAGDIEVKWRWDKQPFFVPVAEAVDRISAVITEERKTNKLFLAQRGENDECWRLRDTPLQAG